MIAKKHYGLVKNGRLTLESREGFEKNLIQFEGKKVYLEIHKADRVRSPSQNKYYWKLVEQIAEETGDDKQSVHKLMKRKFLPDDVYSTKKLTSQSFTQYCNDISSWAFNFLGIIFGEDSISHRTGEIDG